MSQTCVLCDKSDAVLFLESTHNSWGMRRYFRCDQCQLTFMDPAQQLSFDEERARYTLHENHLNDPEYIKFLKRLAAPVAKEIQPGDVGLDYGCGPTPAMKVIFNEYGHDVVSYDPHFANDKTVLNRQYDFIVCSETAEHFYAPAQEFNQFNKLLKNGATLGVMTLVLDDTIDFDQWHYRHDPTHVSFYQRQTFEWIADHLKWSLDFPQNNVAIMKKK